MRVVRRERGAGNGSGAHGWPRSNSPPGVPGGVRGVFEYHLGGESVRSKPLILLGNIYQIQRPASPCRSRDRASHQHDRDNGAAKICGSERSARAYREPSRDHIKPRSRRHHFRGNQAIVCGQRNQAKGSLSLERWLNRLRTAGDPRAEHCRGIRRTTDGTKGSSLFYASRPTPAVSQPIVVQLLHHYQRAMYNSSHCVKSAA